MSKDNVTCVIGGAGFLGSRLALRLGKNNKKFFLGDINVSCEKTRFLDIEDLGSLDCLAGSHCIVNLAAVHHDDVRPLSRYDDVNVQGSVNVCKAARKHGIEKIVFTSSVAIYGFAEPNTGETGAPNFFNDYGRTKYLAEQVYKEWQAEDPESRSLVIVRPTVIFGEGNRGNVFNLLKQIASRRFVMFGNGENFKSMAYVENVAAFLELSLAFSPGLHIFNYVDKPDMSMNELITVARKTLFGSQNVGLRLPASVGIAIGALFDIFAVLLRRSLPISSIRVKKFMATTQFNSATGETGFVAPYTLAEGLEKTLQYEFLENNQDRPTFETE